MKVASALFPQSSFIQRKKGILRVELGQETLDDAFEFLLSFGHIL